MYPSSLKEFNLLWMYMQWTKFVPASYIPIINSNLPQPQKNKKKKKDVHEQFAIQSWVAHFQMHWDQFIIVGTWKLLQVKSIDSNMVQHWDGQDFLVSSFFFVAIVSYKLQQLRLRMGQMAKKSG